MFATTPPPDLAGSTIQPFCGPNTCERNMLDFALFTSPIAPLVMACCAAAKLGQKASV